LQSSQWRYGVTLGVACVYCNDTLADNDQLKKHNDDVHNKRSTDFKCSLCQKIIRTNIGIERHTELFCEKCRKCSPERTSFDLHMGTHKSKSDQENPVPKNMNKRMDPFICELCGQKFPEIGELNKHECGDTVPVTRCDECDFSSNKVPEIVEHVRKAHKKELQCNFCELKATEKDVLTEHIMNMHTDLALLNTVAVQLSSIQDSFAFFEVFKDELKVVLNQLIDSHNSIKQELFVIRNVQKDEEKKINEVKDAIINIPKSSIASAVKVTANAKPVSKDNINSGQLSKEKSQFGVPFMKPI
jgi:hypothetical protein